MMDLDRPGAPQDAPHPAPGEARAARRQDAAAEDVIHHMTHDLRAAMRALRSLPDWIEDDFGKAGIALPASVADHLATLRSQIARLDKMLVDLRDYAGVGKPAARTEIVDFRALLEGIIGELGLAGRFDVTLDLQVARLRGPEDDFARMFTAILDNAARHHDRPRGRITVTAQANASGLVIDIVDDGPGIDRRYHQAVFERMTVLTRRDRADGAGLGLPIAKRVAESLRGTIAVRPGKYARGCTIRIALPLTVAVPA